jgi:cytochrome c556
MRSFKLLMVSAVIGLAAVAVTQAHEDKEELPAGPVHDRHELMEEVGKNAKAIGDAIKAGETAKVSAPATAIAAAAKQVPALFPAGSEHPKSRAKKEIWQHPEEFAALTKKLEETATALAAAANQGGDVGAASKELFANCKACHDKFRIPED